MRNVGLNGLKTMWTEKTEGRMQAVTIVEDLDVLEDGQACVGSSFEAMVETPPAKPPLTPIVPPRGGQLGTILAAGLFNSLLLDIDGSPAAVRGDDE